MLLCYFLPEESKKDNPLTRVIFSFLLVELSLELSQLQLCLKSVTMCDKRITDWGKLVHSVWIHADETLQGLNALDSRLEIEGIDLFSRIRAVAMAALRGEALGLYGRDLDILCRDLFVFLGIALLLGVRLLRRKRLKPTGDFNLGGRLGVESLGGHGGSFLRVTLTYSMSMI